MTSTDIPATYNAIGYRHGESIQVFNLPIPQPDPDDVLIHVYNSSINPVDWKLPAFDWFENGKKGPVVIGRDMAGVVLKTGANVTHVQPGDEVVSYADVMGQGCWATAGEGGYAIGHKDVTVKKYPDIPYCDIGVYPVAFLTAYDGLCAYPNTGPDDGENIYITGAGSGVSSFAIQLARMKTRNILSSASRAPSFELGEKLGVFDMFNYKTDDALAAVKKFTHGELMDVVYDTTYSEKWQLRNVKLVKHGGRFIYVGNEAPADSDLAHYAAQHGITLIVSDVIRYSRQPDKYNKKVLGTGLERAQEWYLSGKVKPHIEKTINASLDTIVQALEDNKNGIAPPGKVAINLKY